MAKKVTSGKLFETDEPIPETVANAVDKYITALRAANKAREKMNTAKDNCIAEMTEHGVERVRIEEGSKWLVCEDEFKLKTEKIKEQSDA